jgi:hypothetical protein
MVWDGSNIESKVWRGSNVEAMVWEGSNVKSMVWELRKLRAVRGRGGGGRRHAAISAAKHILELDAIAEIDLHKLADENHESN